MSRKPDIVKYPGTPNLTESDSSKKGLVLVSKVAEYCGMGKVVVNTLLTLNLIPFH